MAIDGSVETDWLLPDGQLGWIELRFQRTRHVRNVRILNARNRHFLDRGAHKISVSVFSNSKPTTREVELAPPSMNPQWKELRFDAPHVTRIRIDVLSVHGLGGGLAEIVVN